MSPMGDGCIYYWVGDHFQISGYKVVAWILSPNAKNNSIISKLSHKTVLLSLCMHLTFLFMYELINFVLNMYDINEISFE